MMAHPEQFQIAASFDWETLIPILFFILYGIAQFFGSKKKGEAGGDEGVEEPEVDPMERARQIREEIRRKIEERKQAAETAARGHGRQVAYDPNVPENQQRRAQTVRELSQPARGEPRPQRRFSEPQQRAPHHIPDQEPLIVKKAEHVLDQKASMQRRIQEQRQRLEQARRHQEEVRQRARKLKLSTGKAQKSLLGEPERGQRAVALASLRRELLAGLDSKQSLRKAVLYREILDPPLGLR